MYCMVDIFLSSWGSRLNWLDSECSDAIFYHQLSLQRGCNCSLRRVEGVPLSVSLNSQYYGLGCWWKSVNSSLVGLKSLLRQGLSEPDFYGDLMYKLKIVSSNNFSAQFIKIISHDKKIGYNINVLQRTACLVVNPITVSNFAFLFNCTPVGRTSDSVMVPT